MYHDRKIRYTLAFLVLIISVIIFMILNICIGSVRISVSDILESAMGNEIENSRILWDIRMPRAMAAMILGGALALAGYLLQTFFHNPIAGPFVLGISSGANFIGSILASEKINKPIITIFADDNKKYLSTELSNNIDKNKNFISNQIRLTNYEVVN